MKNKIFNILLLLCALCAFTGCSDDKDLIFDSELPQFATRADAILLEVIMPQGTSVNDEIYIVGAFNGGIDAAVGDSRWLLEKAANSDVKWGIYLYPSDFVDGKTLADGYCFYNKTEGAERTLDNKDALHTESAALGARANVSVNRWQSYFDKLQDPTEIEHDGKVIYILNSTSWDNITVYAWGDAEIFGGWPGAAPTGKVTVEGADLLYFDTGSANEGLNVNLIFNNGGDGIQLGDYNVTLDQDYYLEVTDGGVSVWDPEATVTHDGYAVFVYDITGWDDITMYMWGDVNDLNGGWPGMAVTGTQKVNGVTYKYFDFGEGNTGLSENLIFNNNGGGVQLADFAFTIDRDIYLEVSATGITEVDPETYQPGEAPEPVEKVTCEIYVRNKTGWENLYLYAWGEGESFGGWPGTLPARVETFLGAEFCVYEYETAGGDIHLIFNNGEGTQLPDYDITGGTVYYLDVTAAGVTETRLNAPKRR